MVEEINKTVFQTSDGKEFDSKLGALRSEYRFCKTLPCFFCDGSGNEKKYVGIGLAITIDCHHCKGSGEMDWDGTPIFRNVAKHEPTI